MPFVHVDAYRLGDASELADLDIDWDRSIAVVEWGRGMLEGIVDDWLEIEIERSHSADDETRIVTFHGVGPRGDKLAHELGRGASA